RHRVAHILGIRDRLCLRRAGDGIRPSVSVGTPRSPETRKSSGLLFLAPDLILAAGWGANYHQSSKGIDHEETNVRKNASGRALVDGRHENRSGCYRADP